MRLLDPRPETVTAEVVIHRPVQDVYGFYRNFANLPQIVGDVVAVEALNDASYRWVVAGPFGVRVRVTVTVTEQQTNHLLRYETRAPGPLRARWQLVFDDDGDPDLAGTRVREQLTIPLGGLGNILLAMVGKFPGREVTANLTRLKQLLEAGPAPSHPADAEGTR
jgi:uncharacterized membrane protein